MIRVKYFEDGPISLAEDINKWLKENPKFFIKKIIHGNDNTLPNLQGLDLL